MVVILRLGWALAGILCKVLGVENKSEEWKKKGRMVGGVVRGVSLGY